MTVPPRFAATVLNVGKSPRARRHQVDIYYDYMCPWCAKLFRTLDSSVVPWLEKSPYADRLDIVIRPQVQPWDLPSVYLNEGALIVNALAPGDSKKFWSYTRLMADKREDFKQWQVATELRNDTYKRLSKLIEESTGIKAEEAYALLEVGKEDKRRQLTLDMKRVTKAMRKVGNHVTPTIYLNGIEEVGMDSSFTGDQWKEWIEKNID